MTTCYQYLNVTLSRRGVDPGNQNKKDSLSCKLTITSSVSTADHTEQTHDNMKQYTVNFSPLQIPQLLLLTRLDYFSLRIVDKDRYDDFLGVIRNKHAVNNSRAIYD